MSVRGGALALGVGAALGVFGTLAVQSEGARRKPQPAQEGPAQGGKVAEGYLLPRNHGAAPRPVPKGAPGGAVVRQQVIRLQSLPGTPPGEPWELVVSEIRTPEGLRAVVSDPTGAVVLGGVDIPSAPAPAPPVPPRWAAGALWDGRSKGASLTRFWGPVWVTVEAWKGRQVVGVGVRW